jgi:DNA-binding NtrC family response regulator
MRAVGVFMSKLQIPAAGAPSNERVLSLSPFAEDHLAIDRIFKEAARLPLTGFSWQLSRAQTLADALIALRLAEYAVILCESNPSPHNWKDLLDGASDLNNQPAIIVTSSNADNRLWAEALNLGVYDVIAKPFRQDELIHVVSSGCMHWHRCRQRKAPPMLAAEAGA